MSASWYERFKEFPTLARLDFAQASAEIRQGRFEWGQLIGASAANCLAYAMRQRTRSPHSCYPVSFEPQRNSWEAAP